jgi:AcrR family transcriptional regulator
MSIRERMRQAREDALLDTVMALFAEKGYAAVTTEDIAARAGVSKATLYDHFPSKDAMAVRVVLRILARTLDHVRGLDPRRPAIERFAECVRFALRSRLMVAQAAGDALPALQTIVQDHPDYRARHAEIVAEVSKIVEQAKSEGSADRRANTRVAVHVAIAAVRDIELTRLVTYGSDRAEDVIEGVVGMLCHGLRGAPDAEVAEPVEAPPSPVGRMNDQEEA